MSFGTKGVDTTEKVGASQFMGYGEQEAKINSITIKTSGTGSKNIVFNMETRPIDTSKLKGFTPHADATNGGQVGRVQMYSYWQKTLATEGGEDSLKFSKDIGYIADKLGVREQVDAIQASSLEEYVEKLNGVLTSKFLFWKIVVQEYSKPAGGVGLNYSLGTWPAAKGEHRFIACSNLPGKVKFDKENSFDYKKAEAPAEVTSNGTTDDLPFS